MESRTTTNCRIALIHRSPFSAFSLRRVWLDSSATWSKVWPCQSLFSGSRVMKNRQTTDRWAVWAQRSFFYISVCSLDWTYVNTNAAAPAERPGGLLLTRSCLCIQRSAAGPPPGKQMAGNNTVTHPEHWHPGPGLRRALCYLSACIASEIPPLSSHRHHQIRRYTWVKLTGQLSLISQTYASIMQRAWLLEFV